VAQSGDTKRVSSRIPAVLPQEASRWPCTQPYPQASRESSSSPTSSPASTSRSTRSWPWWAVLWRGDTEPFVLREPPWALPARSLFSHREVSKIPWRSRPGPHLHPGWSRPLPTPPESCGLLVTRAAAPRLPVGEVAGLPRFPSPREADPLPPVIGSSFRHSNSGPAHGERGQALGCVRRRLAPEALGDASRNLNAPRPTSTPLSAGSVQPSAGVDRAR